jgi:hypothetical protein
MSLEMAHKVILPPKKNYIPQFLKQRDINSYLLLLAICRLNVNTSGLSWMLYAEDVLGPDHAPTTGHNFPLWMRTYCNADFDTPAYHMVARIWGTSS